MSVHGGSIGTKSSFGNPNETSIDSKKFAGSLRNHESGTLPSVVKETKTTDVKDGKKIVTTRTVTTTIVNKAKPDEESKKDENAGETDKKDDQKVTTVTQKSTKINETNLNPSTTKIATNPTPNEDYQDIKKTVTTTRVYTKTLTPSNQSPENQASSMNGIKLPTNLGAKDSSTSLKVDTQKLIISPANQGASGRELVSTKTTKTVTTNILTNPLNGDSQGTEGRVINQNGGGGNGLEGGSGSDVGTRGDQLFLKKPANKGEFDGNINIPKSEVLRNPGNQGDQGDTKITTIVSRVTQSISRKHNDTEPESKSKILGFLLDSLFLIFSSVTLDRENLKTF